MSNCRIAGCDNAAVANRLCAKHYMRVRRTGDAATVKPSGRPPKPGGEADRHAALCAEIARLKAENDELRKAAQATGPGRLERQVRELQATIVRLQAELASRDAKAPPPPFPRSREELAALKRQATEARKAKRAALKAARAAEPPEPPELSEKLAELERQLKAARTRIKNLTVEAKAAWADAKANSSTISKAQLRKLQRAVHPDSAPNMSAAQRNEAFQIFSGIKFTVRD